MTPSRRTFLTTTVAALATTPVLLPATVRAAAHAGHSHDTGAGMLTVNPVEHASVVLETPAGVIYVDPVGDPAAYAGFAAPDLVLITHQHGDHYKPDTLSAIRGGAPMITNPAVFDMLPDSLKDGTVSIANGGALDPLGLRLDAIPAYNLAPEKQKFHPQGRDNGYILSMANGYRIYISGDTEDTPEMRALDGIDLAFVCMNLPFTMSAEAAADAVRDFGPKVVYPYHWRGRDGGTQDPEAFKAMVGDAADVRIGNWYG